MHLVVLYGYEGADCEAEQLALTEQLFDAALGELGVVGRGQLCLIVWDFNVEPSKIPCLLQGIKAGLWVDLEAAWAGALGFQPAATCRRFWVSVGGYLRGILWWAVLYNFCCSVFLLGGTGSVVAAPSGS